jgi:uncharacterized protein (TIGR02246 family)
MKKLGLAFCTAVMLIATPAAAGPAEDAGVLVDRWSATYNTNNRNALVELYTPDALLFGTTARTAAKGSEEIRQYFVALDQGNRRNTIKDKTIYVLDDNAVLVAGFYDFDRAGEENQLRPSRFTMLIVKRGDRWLIQHHHSSPLGPP